HRREPDNLFSTFLNATLTHDNTTSAQTMHANAQTTHSSSISTQMNNNSNLIQTTHSNNIDSSDKIQNVDLGEDNKDKDNEECDLPYISEAEFGEYLQEWVEMLEEEKSVSS
ncbi:22810_t:CDS:2, partial [Gigaspora rosea]